MLNNKKTTASMKSFWEEAHMKDKKYELTGSPAEGVLKFLNLRKSLILDTRTCLVIGVGFGYETRYLSEVGVKVSTLDISTKALERVADVSISQYLPDQLHTIPNNTFDLIISHLVTQHMNNRDLEDQINNCIRILNPGGTFAMQFSSANKASDNVDSINHKILIKKQMAGEVYRSLSYIKSIAKKFSGKVTWSSFPIYFPHVNSHWYGIHIKKDDENNKNNKMMALPNQIFWFFEFLGYVLKLFSKKLLEKVVKIF